MVVDVLDLVSTESNLCSGVEVANPKAEDWKDPLLRAKSEHSELVG